MVKKKSTESDKKTPVVHDISQRENQGSEGDALYEGDPLAQGLYKAMLSLRHPKDIEEKFFENYVDFREKTIEESDEIWRNTTAENQTLVTFIKDFSISKKEEKTLFYLAVTLEEKNSNSHSLLFSFPTNDDNLVDRYRHGENLQAEEIIQESSH